jgi:hypothetical protein
VKASDEQRVDQGYHRAAWREIATADHNALGKHVEIVIAPLAG